MQSHIARTLIIHNLGPIHLFEIVGRFNRLRDLGTLGLLLGQGPAVYDPIICIFDVLSRWVSLSQSPNQIVGLPVFVEWGNA